MYCMCISDFGGDLADVAYMHTKIQSSPGGITSSYGIINHHIIYPIYHNIIQYHISSYDITGLCYIPPYTVSLRTYIHSYRLDKGLIYRHTGNRTPGGTQQPNRQQAGRYSHDIILPTIPLLPLLETSRRGRTLGPCKCRQLGALEKERTPRIASNSRGATELIHRRSQGSSSH
jgi:hypothetical protein